MMRRSGSLIWNVLMWTLSISMFISNTAYAINIATPSNYSEVPAEEITVETEGQPQAEDVSTGLEIQTGQELQKMEGEKPAVETEILSPAFHGKKILGNVMITVDAPEGVFPDKAVLSARRVWAKTELSELEKAVSEERREDANVAGAFTYDIKVLVDGEEVEPDTEYGAVKVMFTLAESVVHNTEVTVYHVSEESENGLKAETLETNSDQPEVISVETEGFSYYVVEFTYEKKEYVLEGDKEVSLDTILEKLGLIGEVSNVHVSNEQLFKAEKKDNQWVVKALTAFDSEEWMEVTIDGFDYLIMVTDDNSFDPSWEEEITIENETSYGYRVKAVMKLGATPIDYILFPVSTEYDTVEPPKETWKKGYTNMSGSKGDLVTYYCDIYDSDHDFVKGEYYTRLEVHYKDTDMYNGLFCAKHAQVENTGQPISEKTWNDHKYTLFADNLTREEAKAFAEENGGHLVTITSKEEQNALNQLIRIANLPCRAMLYIGGTVKSGKVQWDTDERETYTNWASGKPDIAASQDGLCVYTGKNVNGISGVLGTWDDYDSDSNCCGFIIEQEPLIITKQPANQNKVVGDKAEFSVIVKGADLKYQWQQSVNNGSTWEKINGEIEPKVNISDLANKNNRLYRCIITGLGGTIVSDSAKLTVRTLSSPQLKAPQLVNGGVAVAWNAVSGAAKYRVYRKTGSGNWTKLADTTSLSYTDKTVVSGTRYTYTVRCITSDGSAFTSSFDTPGKSVTYLAAPKIKSAVIVNGGISLTWNTVTGAGKYRVFRKIGTGGWTKLADTTSLSYTDKAVAAGTKYTYTVRCIANDGSTYTSSHDPVGKTITYIAAPVLKSVSSANGGVQVSWNKSTGAAKYRIYRKTSNTGWTKVGDTTALTYLDKTAVSSTKYTYTVRCITSDGSAFTSYFDINGKSVTYVAAPKIKTAATVDGGISLTWDRVTGAVKYRVFRKAGTGGWAKLVDTTSLAYTDKTAASGTKYSYTVRCITNDGSAYTSSYDPAGKTITYVAAPVLKSVSSANGGVQVSWNKSTGAAKYRIYRKTSNTGWTKVGDTTALTYLDKTAVSGTKYTYTVRCITSDGSAFTSYFDINGKSVTYIAAPKIKSAVNVNGGISLTWNTAAGAVKYRVFRKAGTGGWAKLADTTSLAYTDKTAVSGTKYTYTVRCITTDGGSYTSSYDSVGKTIIYIAAPVLKSVSGVNGGVQISWNKSAGAAKYRIYKKTSGTGWMKIADTAALTYLDKATVSGTKYTYTVRCITSDGSAFSSSFDPVGKSLTYVSPFYTVSFNNNGGKGEILENMNCGRTTYYQLPFPTAVKKDCYFKEWNTKANGTGTAFKAYVNVKDAAAGLGSVKLYAIWQEASSREKSMAQEVFSLVNKRRAAAGLPALTYDADLSAIAMERAKEITHFYEHERPNGEGYFELYDKCGYSYTVTGENIAYGQATAAEVMNSWMNSPAHRDNILFTAFASIGIGCCHYDGKYYWVQNFAGNESPFNDDGTFKDWAKEMLEE